MFFVPNLYPSQDAGIFLEGIETLQFNIDIPFEFLLAVVDFKNSIFILTFAYLLVLLGDKVVSVSPEKSIRAP